MNRSSKFLNNSDAEGGGTRSSSSYYSSAFQSAIHSIIVTWLKSIGIFMQSTEIQDFVKKYSAANPPKPKGKLQFQQDDITNALEEFKRQFHESQEKKRAPRNNPDNLFGKMLGLSKSLNIIDRDELIQYLKWYTTLPDIAPFAETPDAQQISDAFSAMRDNIAPLSKVVKHIETEGITEETVGPRTFEIFNRHTKPFPELMWVIPYFTGDLKSLQQSLCTGSLVCLLAGMELFSDETIRSFKQTDHKSITFDGSSVILVWVYTFGSVKKTKQADERGFEQGNGITYNRRGDVVNPNLAWIQDDEDCDEQVTIIPSSPSEINSYHSLDTEFKNTCDKIMARVGSIAVPIPKQDESEDVPILLEAPVKFSVKKCKHGICGGGEEQGVCKKCDWGE